jgi:hypothetical protein
MSFRRRTRYYRSSQSLSSQTSPLPAAGLQTAPHSVAPPLPHGTRRYRAPRCARPKARRSRGGALRRELGVRATRSRISFVGPTVRRISTEVQMPHRSTTSEPKLRRHSTIRFSELSRVQTRRPSLDSPRGRSRVPGEPTTKHQLCGATRSVRTPDRSQLRVRHRQRSPHRGTSRSPLPPSGANPPSSTNRRAHSASARQATEAAWCVFDRVHQPRTHSRLDKSAFGCILGGQPRSSAWRNARRANSQCVSPGAEPRSGVICVDTRPSSPRAAACDRRSTLRHGTSKLARPTRRPIAVRSARGGHTWSPESARRRLSSTTATASGCEAGAHPGRRRPRMGPGHLLTTDAVRRQRLPPAARNLNDISTRSGDAETPQAAPQIHGPPELLPLEPAATSCDALAPSSFPRPCRTGEPDWRRERRPRGFLRSSVRHRHLGKPERQPLLS